MVLVIVIVLIIVMILIMVYGYVVETLSFFWLQIYVPIVNGYDDGYGK